MGASQQMLLSEGEDAVSAFSPLDVAGCIWWLKAGQITGFSHNDPLDTWQDLSASGRDATATLTVRPLYQTTGGPNGQPYVLFDGINDRLQTANFPAGATPQTILIVLKSAGSSNQYIMNLGTSDALAIVQGYSPGNYSFFTGSHSIMRAISTGAFVRAHTQASTTPAAAMPWILGSATAGVAPFSGGIVEVIHYNSVISAPNLALVQDYLDTEYAL